MVRRAVNFDWAVWLIALFLSVPTTGISQDTNISNNSGPNVVGRYTVTVKNRPMEDDGYWQWYVSYVSDLGKYNKSLAENRIKLASIATERSRTWATRFNLSKMYFEWNAAADDSINFAGLDLGYFFDSAVIEVAKVGPRARASNRKHFTELGIRLKDMQNNQELIIDQVIRSHRKILDRAKAQYTKSGDGRPRLVTAIKNLEQEHKLLPLFLYDFAEWYAPSQLPQLIRDFVFRENLEPNLEKLLTAKAKIGDAMELERKAFTERLRPNPENSQRILFSMATIKGDPLGYIGGRTEVNEILASPTQADVYQITSQTQRLDAIVLLRDILRTDRYDAVAKSLLIQQETYWLKRIAQKLEGQTAMVKNAFSLYLSNRGFSTDDRAGWLPWMSEYLGALWGLGPVALTAGIPGIDLPGANAEMVGVQLMEAARARMAIVALIKLVKSGRSLTDIKELDQKSLTTVLKNHWNPSNPENNKAISRIAIDIYTTLRDLKDLDRLSNDNGDITEFARDVNEYFAKNYFVPVDSRYQSFEWFGDLLNVHNIVTLWGPGAITKVNGKWAKSGYMTFAEQELLQTGGATLSAAVRTSAGKILDNQNIMIAGYNLDTIGETIRQSRSVQLLSKVHAYGARNVIQPSALSALLGESSKLVASFYLNNAITELAASSGIPGAALITELVMSYEVPQGLFDYLIFQAPSVPLTGFIGPLRRYQSHAEETSQRAAQTINSVEQAQRLVRNASEELADNTSINPQLSSTLAQQVDELGESLEQVGVERIDSLIADAGLPPIDGGASSGNTLLATVDAIPQSDALAAEQALSSAVTALQNGEIEEASRALEAAHTLGQTANSDAKTVSNRVSDAIDRLESANPPATVVGSTPAQTVQTGQAGEVIDTGVEALPTQTALADGSSGASPNQTVQADGDTGSSPNQTVQADGDTSSNPNQTVQSDGDTGGSPNQTVLADNSDDPVVSTLNRSTFPPETIDSLEVPLDQRADPPPLIDEKLYTQGVAGEKLRLADEAGLRGNDLDAALAHLNEAQRYAEELEEGSADLLATVQRRKVLLANARDAREMINQFRAAFSDSSILEDISEGDLNLILSKLQSGDFVPTTSGLNPAIEINLDGRKFRLKPGLDINRSELDVIGGAVASSLGLDAPPSAVIDGSGVRINLNGTSIDLGKVVVSRHIDNFVPLYNLDEATLLALRLDYADQRTLRALLADSDAHLGNIGLGPNGKLWVIDNDLANLDTDPILLQAASEFHNQAEVVEAAVTFAHGGLPQRKREFGLRPTDDVLKIVKTRALYQWIARADQMVSYKDLAPLVEKIKDITQSETELLNKLIGRGIDPERAREVISILKTRAEVLEGVLSKPALFGGGAMRAGLILNHIPNQLFSWRNFDPNYFRYLAA
ncbi:MAG: hypothetical protein AAF478_13875 [Pseudomonadota bacterium]